MYKFYHLCVFATFYILTSRYLFNLMHAFKLGMIMIA